MEKTFELGIFRKCHTGLAEKEVEDAQGRNQTIPPRSCPKHPKSHPAPPNGPARTLIAISVILPINVIADIILLLGTREGTAHLGASSTKRTIGNLLASSAVQE
jgi:hypothetical protein